MTIDSSTCGTNGTCTTYDALGRIVEKNVAGVYTQFLYGPTGKLGLMNGQTLVNAYLPLPGGEIYNIAPGYGRFWHRDWLGTIRLSSMRSNRSVDYDRAFAPFGEVYKNFGSTANNNFTGDTQDTIAGTYDTPNRELNPSQGRWMSPDPAGLSAVSLSNPPSWNRYAYTVNDPLRYVDPLGLRTLVWKDCVTSTWGDGDDHTICYLYTIDVPDFMNLNSDCSPADKGCNKDPKEPKKPLAANKGQKAPCLAPSALTAPERWELNAASFYAQNFKTTVGFGIGSSGATGIFPGPKPSVGGALSSMLVADATGNTALVTTITYNSLNFGAGTQGGLQVALGGEPITPGWSGSGSASGSFGAGLGVGVDVSSTGTLTLNFGVGLGAKYSATISNLNASYALPICRE